MDLGLILSGFTRALGQTGDPRFRRVLFIGVGLTIVLLAGAAWITWFGIGWAIGDDASLPWIGTVPWLNDLAAAGGLLAMMVVSVFLMVPVASAITSMYLDQVAEAVEDRHYPELPPVPGTSFAEDLRDTLGFLGVIILANLVALVFYLFLAPLAPFIFWGLNGYLLGREYFTLAAMRRLGRAGAEELRRRNMGMIWLGGILMAIPLTVPILNLVVPILGAATFTHIFHGLAAKRR